MFEAKALDELNGRLIVFGKLDFGDFEVLFLHLAKQLRQQKFADAQSSQLGIDLEAQHADGRLPQRWLNRSISQTSAAAAMVWFCLSTS